MESLKKLPFVFAFFLLSLILSVQCFAQRGGGGFRGVSLSGSNTLSFGLGLTNSDQSELNSVMDTANAAQAGGNVKNLGSGLEFFAQYGSRFEGSMWGVIYRPSFMSQSSSGTCLGGKCKYEVSGFAFFPMLRMVPLENEMIKLFFQLGLGYGSMEGKITQPGQYVKFKGSSFGSIAGLGVDICFSETHCVTLEGNFRYLPIERNLVTGGSGTGMSGISGGSAAGEELERGGQDLSTTMSGLQTLIAYTVMF
jgi:hypothetical protein